MKSTLSPLPALGLSLLLLFGGCRTEEPPRPGSPPAEQPPPPPAEQSPPPLEGQATTADPAGASGGENSPAEAAEVDVQIMSWDEVQQLIEQHRDQVVVVDIWSTWCVPCLREFPHLVGLQRTYGDRLACISVNIDYIGLPDEPPESFRDRVLEFLRKQQAGDLIHVISSDPDEQVLTAVGAAAIPAVLIFDRQGQLQKTFTNDDQEYGEEGFTYPEHIVPLVEQLLGE